MKTFTGLSDAAAIAEMARRDMAVALAEDAGARCQPNQAVLEIQGDARAVDR